jgi:ubiquinone/menaquinone biosynthesis C-methylase UbiE
MTDLAYANRKFFDDISSAYDMQPWFQKMNDQVFDALTARLGWVGVSVADIKPDGHKEEKKEVKLLDYACGTGIMSRVSPLFLPFGLPY